MPVCTSACAGRGTDVPDSSAVEAAFAKEGRQRQAHGMTAPGTSLGADLRQANNKRAPRSSEKAAQVTGAKRRTVEQAKRVKKEAPDLLEAVKAGTLALDKANNIVRQREKAEKVATIAEHFTAPLDSLGPFPVLYADPPWHYDFAESSTRRIENHYPTMQLDEIKALEVPACDNSILYLWATSPKLTEALEVLQAWGFEYATCAVWVKPSIGMGYYFRQRHELLLVGKRGALPTPDAEDRPDSVIEAASGTHSEKPEKVYELLERMYPLLDRVELFARQARPGWASWGNQV